MGAAGVPWVLRLCCGCGAAGGTQPHSQPANTTLLRPTAPHAARHAATSRRPPPPLGCSHAHVWHGPLVNALVCAGQPPPPPSRQSAGPWCRAAAAGVQVWRGAGCWVACPTPHGVPHCWHTPTQRATGAHLSLERPPSTHTAPQSTHTPHHHTSHHPTHQSSAGCTPPCVPCQPAPQAALEWGRECGPSASCGPCRRQNQLPRQPRSTACAGTQQRCDSHLLRWHHIQLVVKLVLAVLALEAQRLQGRPLQRRSSGVPSRVPQLQAGVVAVAGQQHPAAGCGQPAHRAHSAPACGGWHCGVVSCHQHPASAGRCVSSLLQLPHAHCAGSAAGCQQLAIGGEGEAGHRLARPVGQHSGICRRGVLSAHWGTHNGAEQRPSRRSRWQCRHKGPACPNAHPGGLPHYTNSKEAKPRPPGVESSSRSNSSCSMPSSGTATSSTRPPAPTASTRLLGLCQDRNTSPAEAAGQAQDGKGGAGGATAGWPLCITCRCPQRAWPEPLGGLQSSLGAVSSCQPQPAQATSHHSPPPSCTNAACSFCDS